MTQDNDLTDQDMAAAAERQSALLANWRKVRTPTVPHMTGVAPVGSRFPLSLSQEMIWTFEQVYGGASLFNVPNLFRFDTALEAPRLNAAFRRVIERHAVLRMRFVRDFDTPLQELTAADEFCLAVVQLDGPSVDWEDHALALAGEDHARPFDPSAGGLVRALLIRGPGAACYLSLTLHHLVTDGWSMGLFFAELLAAYEGRPPKAEDLAPPQFMDYAAGQRARVAAGGLGAAVDHWRNELAGLEPLELPCDHVRPPARSFRGGRTPLEIEPSLTKRLRRYCRETGFTPYIVLAGACRILLFKLSRQVDAAVGAYTANRSHAGAARTIGPFATVCPLRIRLKAEMSFEAVLQEVRRSLVSALPHQEAPFEWVAAQLGLTGDRSRSPAFQVALNLQKASDVAFGAEPPDGVTRRRSSTPAARFDLEVYLEELEDRFDGELVFATDLFTERTAASIAKRLVRVLDHALADPAAAVASLQALLPDEGARLALEWNATSVPLPTLCADELIARQAAKQPNQPALLTSDGAISYGDIELRAEALASRLQAHGVGRDRVVGLYIPRSAELVVAALAVLKAGGAFLALENAHPAARIGRMLRQSEAVLALHRGRPPAELPEFSGRWVDFADLETAPYKSAPLTGDRDPTSLAYVIFTSGSTGEPKGVMVEHRSLVNNLLWMQRQFALGCEDRVLFKTPVSFDVSVWELLWPLTAGAATVVAAPDGETDPVYLGRLMAETGVTTAQFVPSLLAVLMDCGALRSATQLRRVISIGEALPGPLARRFLAESGAELHNLYGPAEATLHATHFPVAEAEGGQTPIGRPISNSRVYVLGPDGGLAPTGVYGELCIAGACVARGYIGAPQLTAERFAPDPFVEGESMYRTGDIGRWTFDGVLEFKGRVDDQIKLRGVRIELGEVEAALQGAPGVRQAAVAVRDGSQLVAYVVPAQGLFDVVEARRHLANLLPAQMTPDLYVATEQLPLNENGKLDRRALAALAGPPIAATRTPPADELEVAVLEIWCELFGVEDLSVEDDFIELGGHSLLAVRGSLALADRLDREIDPQVFYAGQTVRGLAALLR